MSDYGISADADRLYRDALVWDMVLPYEPDMGNGVGILPRWMSRVSVLSRCIRRETGTTSAKPCVDWHGCGRRFLPSRTV